MHSSGPHDEFLELCAVSTSGQLTPEENARLREHLSSCPSCREALRQYESIINEGIPSLSVSESDQIDPGPGWSQSKAEKVFFEGLAREGNRSAIPQPSNANGIGATFRRALPVAPESTWRHVWMLYAAGILLFVTLGFCAYWVGVRHGTDTARATPPAAANPDPNNPALASTSLEEQLSDAAHARLVARQQIAERDKALIDLRLQLTRQSAEIEHLKEAQAVLESNLRTDEVGKQDLLQQRTELAQKLDVAQRESRTLQLQVVALTQEYASQTAQAKALTAKVDDLTRLLDQRNASLSQQEELLSHDRDIRELMGARDLYIAEVFDVDDHGATRKPYGRVFYTKGKSLIFYAYDLDQLAPKRAQAFQAWGRRGPNWQEALNLGIFYEDNASKKRWVLKLDDPKTLAQIDGVFVTVEPHGGSGKPSGKPLLSAYLRLNPNHP